MPCRTWTCPCRLWYRSCRSPNSCHICPLNVGTLVIPGRVRVDRKPSIERNSIPCHRPLMTCLLPCLRSSVVVEVMPVLVERRLCPSQTASGKASCAIDLFSPHSVSSWLVETSQTLLRLRLAQSGRHSTLLRVLDIVSHRTLLRVVSRWLLR